MAPVFLNPLGPSPTIHDQSQLLISADNNQSTSLSYCTCFHILDQTQTKDIRDLRHGDQEDGKLVLDGGSSNNHQVCNSSFVQPNKSVMGGPTNACGHRNLSLYKIEDERGHGCANWMSSNVRLARKMMNSPSSDLATNKAFNITGVCADCNTTSTPLWRSGPNGPKSLCNACGIRQRKARRAMAEAANGFAPCMNASFTKNRVHHKEKKSRINHFSRFKNKCKVTAAAGTSQQEEVKVDFKDFATNLRDNSGFEQVFPMDEVAEAALLLMNLSCGFVYF